MVTAVMMVYNEEKYISIQLDSILKQSVAVDKIIIVDDQSTDNTNKIISTYKNKFPQIQYYLNPNKGKVNAYNLGLSKVETDWFFVCAGDDCLFQNYVESQLQLIKSKNLDFVYSKYIITDEDLKPIVGVPRKQTYSFEELLKSNRVSGYYFASSKVLPFIRELPNYFRFEDWATSLLLTFNFGDAHVNKAPLFYYRRHAKSTTQLLNKVGVRKRDIFFIDNLLRFKRINLSEDQEKMLNKRLKYYKIITGEFSYRFAIQLLFSKTLLLNEKIRLTLHFLPGLKDDNDVEIFIHRILSTFKK